MKDTHIGIGSYAFRYNVGITGFRPEKPLDTTGFIEAAVDLGLKRVLLCENLGIDDLTDGQLAETAALLKQNNLISEIGMRDITAENLRRHIRICSLLGSNFIRVVCGNPEPYPSSEPENLKSQALGAIRAVLPDLQEQGIFLGIENHFDLPTDDLVEIADTIDDPHVGLILDTTNGLGFIERVDETAAKVSHRLLSVHLKDYRIRKGEAGYQIEGTVLGEGILDYERLLRELLEGNSEISIILELTIARPPALCPEEAAAREMEQIRRSVGKLKETMKRIRREANINV